MRWKAPRRISAYVSMYRLEIGMYVLTIIGVVHDDLSHVQSVKSQVCHVHFS